MARFFTYCWQHREVRGHPDGEPIGFAYGSQFSRRGLCPNDLLYIVSVNQGHVHLLGKMLVGQVTYCAHDYLRWVGVEPEPALEYVIAHECTPARLVRVPDQVAQRLRFRRGMQFTALTFRDGLLAERQSLRGVRRLSPDSAEALDELLPAMEPYRSMPLRLPEGQTVSACRYCELRGRAGQYCA
jgi:hypothetical protein